MDENSDEELAGSLTANYVSIYHAITKLNDALAIDYVCIDALFRLLMPCSPELAYSSVEAYKLDQVYVTNVLGIINSIFSYTANGRTYSIVPVYEQKTLKEFRLGVTHAVDNTGDTI